MAQSNMQDQADQVQQEKAKSEHPEWCVNGKYYSDEEQYNSAKKEYDEKVAAAKEAAMTQAMKKAEAQEKIKYEINNSIYGEGAGTTLAKMEETIGGVEMSAILGNADEVAKRQHQLDPTNYKSEIKKPNTGKFPHNEDAFPVDLKIEEMEVHKPDVKIHEITTHVHGEPAARAALLISDTTEKRLIHLENNMATLMRYFFRLGTRVNINCVYYGGQSPFTKYKSIRCLNHDRVAEGQNVQIDQCLTCTRFEPIYGQCYELMNDLGANVAAILDDNQMAYADMDDYMKLDRIEKFIEENPDAKIDLTKTLTRSMDSDPEFKSGGLVAWGPGVEMDWTPVPKEEQKCHINWRQSINDDGTNMKRLSSFPKDERNFAGSSFTGGTGGGAANKMILNYNAMESNSNSELSGWISAGKTIQGNPDPVRSDLLNGKLEEIKTACKGMSIDKVLVFAIMYNTGKTAAQTVSEYGNLKGTVGDNPALIISAMGSGPNAINGDGGQIPALWDWWKKNETESSSGRSASSDSDGKKKYPKLDESKKEDWLWTEFAELLGLANSMNGKSAADMELFPKVCYTYYITKGAMHDSSYDSDEYAFPFTDEDIQAIGGFYYTGAFGESRPNYSPGVTHRGVDLSTGQNTEIHAIHDGIVTSGGVDDNGWASTWNGVCIDHGDGTYSRYLHLSSVNVHKGDKVSKGDVIGREGGWGANGPGHYDIHLHLEFGHGGAENATSDTNPLSLYPNLLGIDMKVPICP